MSGQAKSFNDLISGEIPVLVDFYATWCGPCQQLSSILQEVASQIGDQVKIIKVDVDKNPLAASKYQVRGVPTLILFQQGEIRWRQSGVVPQHQLIQSIKNNISTKV
ncbi:thioredoxin [Belliella kenyensis]|uniref:Thioredoxin n=1 Tax=Belliella kenyensis TaxID=1472724 RepID=A0ABV8EGZ4_9BACT|nr:thioredoxin [Belliella kenyensis]MCH7402441.1 thioredoxin [Belliella kenyensis]MDN3603632.1 thioredoxin [Belliella kenyensis]